MSFRTARAGLHSGFDLVRRSLLQAPGLPFADTLSAEQIRHAFDAEGKRKLAASPFHVRPNKSDTPSTPKASGN
jgi:hypothetical protein